MAPTVHCHVPVTVRVHGMPDDAALAALREAVSRQVRDRLAEAERVLSGHDDRSQELDRPGPAAPGLLAEAYDESREGPGWYAVPSYGQRGRRVAVPISGPPPGRPWRVLRAVYLRARVDEFGDYVESVAAGAEVPVGSVLPERALFEQLGDQERTVTVWLVEVRTPMTLGELGGLVDARATELLGGGAGKTLLSAKSPMDRDLTALAEFDRDGQIATLPVLRRTNARRVTGTKAEAQLLFGARVVWAGMQVPAVTPATLLEAGPASTVRVPLAQLAATVDAAVFEQRNGFAWQAMLDEAGTRPVRVDVLPLRARRDLGERSVNYAGHELLMAARMPAADPDAVVDDWVADVGSDIVPQAVRDVAAAWGAGLPALPPMPRGKGSTPPAPHPAPDVAAGAIVVSVAVHLPFDPETLGAAHWRPAGRKLAVQVRQLLSRDTGDLRWKYPVYDWMSGLGHAPDARPPGGTPWEYALEDLDATGDLVRFFDAVEGAGWETLTLRLLWHSTATRFRTHPRVQALFEKTRVHWLDVRKSTYRLATATTPASVEIDREEDQRVTVGIPGRDVLGNVSSAFVHERKVKEISPAAAARLRAALEVERVELTRRIATGAETRELDQETFLREVVASAAERAHLTNDDWVSVTVESSLRLLDVRWTPVHDLPFWTVRLVRVERREGTREWTTVGTPFERTCDEFEAAIIYAQLGKAGEFYMALGLAISVIGLIAVAWEAGIIGALVAAGGGAKAVLLSIAISELIYAIRVVFFDAKLSVEGFLMAAVEGYLGALGFRAGALAGAPLAKAIGTSTVRRVWAGIIVEKLAVGVVGGSATAVLSRFAHDVVDIAIHDGQLSSWRTYVHDMGIGAAFGVLAEFSVAPVMRALGSGGRTALTSVTDLVEQLRADKFTLAQFGAATTEALANLRASAAMFAQDVAVSGLAGAFSQRAEQAFTAWAASVTARRVLELSGATFTRQATEGLERFLAAAEDRASAEATRRLAATFANRPQEAVRLMEVLASLEPAQARHLMTGTFTTSGDLASFLGRIAHYAPDQQRGILALLAEADLVALPPGAGSSAQEIAQRQLEGALRVQSEAARRRAAQLRRDANTRFARAVRVDQTGARARADTLLAEAAAIERQAAEAERVAEELAARRVTPATPGIPGAPGTPARIGDLPVDLPGDNPAALADELDAALTALEAGTDTRQNGVWIQLPARIPGPEQARALARVVFTSRSGNPVVFRVEGGTGALSERSREFVHVDPATGATRIRTRGDPLNINVGSFERAVEFILEARPGARLKVFEIDAGYLANLRSNLVPEQGGRTLLHPVDDAGNFVPGAAQQTPGRLGDVRRVGRTVDTRTAVDQLQLDASIAAELNDFIVPGSGRVLEFTPGGRTGK